ncbi:MAG TPA: hypothetical protein PKE15_00290 [Ottowia sp.]|nr:hypothetical protein [Ottowia sp.]
MSWALITDDHGDGRYTIELDFGEDLRAALVGALDQALTQLAYVLSVNLGDLAIAEAAEAAQRATAAQFVESIIAMYGPGAFDESGGVIGKAALGVYEEMLTIYAQMRAKHKPLRDEIERIKFEQIDATKQRAKWAAFVALETRQAWCADYTEGAGGYVATIDIKGEGDHVLIAPGARWLAPSDGVLSPTDLMSPEQAFFNYAILPGWQKFKPTYRTGTITALDYDAHTASVTLGPETSSAQRLGINQAASLSAVPVDYMTCGAGAFEVGDDVVVEFQGRDWRYPRVIGFVDNPRWCPNFPPVTMDLVFDTEVGPSTGSSLWTTALKADGCPVWVRGYSYGGLPYLAPNAPTATMGISLEPPVFAEPDDNTEKLEIHTAGASFGSPLWSGSCSALGWGVRSGEFIPAVPTGGTCDDVFASDYGIAHVAIKKLWMEPDHYALSMETVTYSSHDCIVEFPATSGVWMGGGTVMHPITMGNYVHDEWLVLETPEDFLTSRSSMPTISVARKGGGIPVPYALTNVTRTWGYRHTIWRFHFAKA